MEFLDANIFIYAYYKPKRELNPREKRMKSSAKDILTKISEGQIKVMTTVVHLSEVVNILKHGLPIKQLNRVITTLFMLDSLEIIDVRREDYLAAAELGAELLLDPNDALAIQVMRLHDLD